MGGHHASSKEVEILIRSRHDPYVHASQITRGCSNCQGYPHGLDGPIGWQTFACSSTPSNGHTQSLWRRLSYPKFLRIASGARCFGQPARFLQIWGLCVLALAFGLVAFVIPLFRCLACRVCVTLLLAMGGIHGGLSGAIMHSTGLSAGACLCLWV